MARCKAAKLYIAAATSSKTTPRPPGHLRSIVLAGQGLSTSEALNSKKPKMITVIPGLKPIIVTKYPATSSITIRPSSLRPKTCSALVLIKIARTRNMDKKTRYPQKVRRLNTKNSIIPASVRNMSMRMRHS